MQKSSASLAKGPSSRKLDVSIYFNCIVEELCAYELPSENAELMDVLLAPCDPKHRSVAKCMCTISGEVDLPQTQAKKVRVFEHGVYRPGEKPDRRLLVELDLK